MRLMEALRRSIRYKIVAAMLAGTVTSLGVACVSLAVYDLRAYEQQWSNDLITQADILGHFSAEALTFDDAKAATTNLRLLKAHPRIVEGIIYDARGRRFASHGGNDGVPPPTLPESDGVRRQGGDLVVFKRIVENGEIVGTVYLRAHHELARRLAGYLGILGAVMALSVVAAVGMAMWLQPALSQPVLAVTRAAHEVMERRDFSLRVPKTTEDEVGYLVDAFNGMLAELGRRAEALQKSDMQRQRAEEALRTLNLELERRVADRTLQVETANKELESFSYSVSHDLRAPLRGIVGFAEAVLEDDASTMTSEARRKVDIILHEGHRMGVLINDLLAFSRLGRKSLQMSEVRMTDLVSSTWGTLKAQQESSGSSQHVVFTVGTLPPARGDRVLLGQVWVNLLSNALKFSARRPQPQITVNAITDEREHIYFVRDNGAGFNPSYKAKLFGVFQRLHDAAEFPGTGVGLALVQRIVNRHGGRVWAEGSLDEGATFYFSLPREVADGTV